MKASILILVALGLVAAFCAALLTTGLKPNARRTASAAEPIAVLVAARDMPSMTIITEEAFESATILPAEAPAGVVSQPLMIVGKPLARSVVKGQPLTRDCFALNSLGVEMVSTLPKGKRAVTVELALSSGHEGLLYPGCQVDVLATFRMERGSGEGVALSTTLLQGVEVIAIDSETVSTAESSAVANAAKPADNVNLHRKTLRVTLMVDPRQAEALQLATEHGSVSLSMRNPLDDTDTDQEPTLLNQGRLASLAEYLGSAVPKRTDEPINVLASDEPAPQVNAPQRRDITVLRGTQIEVRSLVDDGHSAGKVADRL